jgi:hypothetical protein
MLLAPLVATRKLAKVKDQPGNDQYGTTYSQEPTKQAGQKSHKGFRQNVHVLRPFLG